MQLQKIIYRLSTALFSCWMLLNAYAYLTSAEAQRICQHFGFPGYFRIELAFAKIIGVMALALPLRSGRLKEWAYAGFVITLVSGFIAHVSSGDSFLSSSAALAALALLLASYCSYQKLILSHYQSKKTKQ